MKNTILGSLLVSSLVLGMFGATASAGTAEGKTKGDVTFEQGETPVTPVDPTDPTDPTDPDETIDPNPVETDGVAILHAPSFHFGNVKVNPLGDTYPVLESGFTSAKDGHYYAPDFLQVADVSGKDTLIWDVSVAQEAAFTAATDQLEHTRIHLKGQTITNSNNVTGLSGFVLNTEGYTEIPVGTAVSVLSSANKGATNNTITSSVFKEGYTQAIRNEEQGNNEDVLLSVPAGETPKAGKEYSTNLVWTLSVTP